MMFFSAALSGAETVLTLDEAISTAIEKSPLRRVDEHLVAASAAAEDASLGELLPQAAAYAGYARLSDPAAVVPIKRFGGTPPFFSRDHYGMGMSLKIPLFQGGVKWKALDAARLSGEIAGCSLRFTTQELVANITNVFNRILYLEKQVESSSFTLSALKKARDDARARLESGRIAPVELMKMECQVHEQEQAIVTSREERLRTRQLLAQLVGLDCSDPPSVKGGLLPPDGSRLMPPESVEISLRPDIVRLEKEVELARTRVKQMQGYHLPVIALEGDYGRRAGSGLDGSEEVWSGGISISMNIFSGGAINARVRQARAELLAAEERLRNARLAAVTQLKSAWSRIREAGARYAAASQESETARETWRIEELRYRKGAGSVTDSLLAQAAWFQADVRRLAAVYEYNAAVTEYLLASGAIDAGEAGGRTVSLEDQVK